jgi:hypothetical protein
MSGQALNDLGGKDLVDVPHAPLAGYGLAVRHCNAGAFLSPVLEGIKTQVRQSRRLRVTMNSENPTVVVKLVVRERKNREAIRRELQ